MTKVKAKLMIEDNIFLSIEDNQKHLAQLHMVVIKLIKYI